MEAQLTLKAFQVEIQSPHENQKKLTAQREANGKLELFLLMFCYFLFDFANLYQVSP